MQVVNHFPINLIWVRFSMAHMFATSQPPQLLFTKSGPSVNEANKPWTVRETPFHACLMPVLLVLEYLLPQTKLIYRRIKRIVATIRLSFFHN